MTDDLVTRLDDINRNYDLARGVHSTIRDAKARIEALTAERDEYKRLALITDTVTRECKIQEARAEKAEADNARLQEMVQASVNFMNGDLTVSEWNEVCMRRPHRKG